MLTEQYTKALWYCSMLKCASYGRAKAHKHGKACQYYCVFIGTKTLPNDNSCKNRLPFDAKSRADFTKPEIWTGSRQLASLKLLWMAFSDVILPFQVWLQIWCCKQHPAQGNTRILRQTTYTELTFGTFSSLNTDVPMLSPTDSPGIPSNPILGLHDIR